MESFSARFRELPRHQPVLTLAIAIVAVEVVGASGSIFTAQGLNGWYETLHRPAIAPPNWVFAPVWTTLFALMGIAVWFVWRQVDSVPDKAKVGLGVFTIHFIFNLGWSAVFFGMQNIAGGLVVIGLLWVLIVITIWAFNRVDQRAALLLIPYIIWVSFAAYLNYGFWVLN